MRHSERKGERANLGESAQRARTSLDDFNEPAIADFMFSFPEG